VQDLPFEETVIDKAESEPAFLVDVDGFEGPLDLLLELARRQKVDLHKISVLFAWSSPLIIWSWRPGSPI